MLYIICVYKRITWGICQRECVYIYIYIHSLWQTQHMIFEVVWIGGIYAPLWPLWPIGKMVMNRSSHQTARDQIGPNPPELVNRLTTQKSKENVARQSIQCLVILSISPLPKNIQHIFNNKSTINPFIISTYMDPLDQGLPSPALSQEKLGPQLSSANFRREKDGETFRQGHYFFKLLLLCNA